MGVKASGDWARARGEAPNKTRSRGRYEFFMQWGREVFGRAVGQLHADAFGHRVSGRQT
ncbi:hypothetical protein GCM10023186_24500 [Hymenobacter koreensis]|uniref:Uncharacterized protein n=1 Tax=Hymenobacter koreensis TaxID=1084523 RepID=A0ABP8J288_9BACT